ncbi:MAG TPA: response regulator transcription factor [Ensifer sp.]|nr:response regulator transcription factor [Ensifer sp.]
MERDKLILVVEDDAGMRELICGALVSAGCGVVVAERRDEILAIIAERRPDLITLDLSLQVDDGLDIAMDIRRICNVPIVMISGRGLPLERLAGLEHGADDYITKPFHIKEMLIRVRSVLDRYVRPISRPRDGVAEAANSTLRRSDGCVLDEKLRRLSCKGGVSVELTETETNILAMFFDNPGRILSRNEMWLALRRLEHDPRDRTLDGHITHLRAKLRQTGCEDHLVIKSVRGVGYVFVGEATLPETIS